MKKGDLIAVYGTLRRGERADINKNVLIHSVSFVGNDMVNGNMYHIGAFPGVKLLPSSTQDFNWNLPNVVVEVYHIGDQSVVSILDHYECYPNMYDRTQVITAAGRVPWIYTYNYDIHDDQLIETGDWKNPRLKVTHRVPTIGSN